jgi:hypothetical protein
LTPVAVSGEPADAGALAAPDSSSEGFVGLVDLLARDIV